MITYRFYNYISGHIIKEKLEIWVSILISILITN